MRNLHYIVVIPTLQVQYISKFCYYISGVANFLLKFLTILIKSILILTRRHRQKHPVEASKLSVSQIDGEHILHRAYRQVGIHFGKY